VPRWWQPSPSAPQPSPPSRSAARSSATAAAVIVQGLALLRRLDPALLSGNRRYRPREWAAATLPMGFADLTLILFNSIDVLVLSLFLPADAVGVYFAATRILQLVLFAQYAATAATAPRFAEASARGDDAALRALVRGTVRLTAGASLALGAGLLLVAPWLLDLFGAGFGALAILVCGAALQSSFGPAEDLLNMLGGERVAARVSFAALALAVTLNFALIPFCGIIGAAVAMAPATAARGAALSVAAQRRLGLSTHILA